MTVGALEHAPQHPGGHLPLGLARSAREHEHVVAPGADLEFVHAALG